MVSRIPLSVMLKTAPSYVWRAPHVMSSLPQPPGRNQNSLPQLPLQLWCCHVTWTPPIRPHEPSIGKDFVGYREALLKITIHGRGRAFRSSSGAGPGRDTHMGHLCEPRCPCWWQDGRLMVCTAFSPQRPYVVMGSVPVYRAKLVTITCFPTSAKSIFLSQLIWNSDFKWRKIKKPKQNSDVLGTVLSALTVTSHLSLFATLLILLYRHGHQGTERSTTLPKVPDLKHGGTRIRPQEGWLQNGFSLLLEDSPYPEPAEYFCPPSSEERMPILAMGNRVPLVCEL